MLSKQQKELKKELLALTQIAYEREMNTAITLLDQEFDLWRQKKLSAIDLSEKIHRFHNDTAKEIWHQYVPNTFHDLLVAKAIQKGIILRKEVSSELIEFLAPKIKLFEQE